MEKGWMLSPADMRRRKMETELRAANEVTERYGLRLSDQQIGRVIAHRDRALLEIGRVEFGRGVIGPLLTAFCDSPYIEREDYEQTVMDLLDSFYYFKNESDNLIADEDLIDFMRRYFDEVCQGSLELLNDATLMDLCKSVREDGGAGRLRFR